MKLWLLLISISLVNCAHHESNWAVLVCSSRDWLNYRHVANTLSLYRTVKRLGIPDRNILLMLADDIACNSRNPFPGRVYNTGRRSVDLYGSRVETDYRGNEVSVENFVKVLTGRHEQGVSRSKRMLSDERSNILIYLTGHGGEDFLKFRGTQDLMAQDLADAIAQMHEKGRYREIFLMIDTCEAETMYSKITSPNVIAIASSRKGESSYSQPADPVLGVSLVDRFTSAALDFFEEVQITSDAKLADLIDSLKSGNTNLELKRALRSSALQKTLSVLDFFGHVPITHVINLKNKQGKPSLIKVGNTIADGHQRQLNQTIAKAPLKSTTTTTTIQHEPQKLRNSQSDIAPRTRLQDCAVLLLILTMFVLVLLMDRKIVKEIVRKKD